MQEIALKANANKALFIFYSVMTIFAFVVIAGLILSGFLSWLLGGCSTLLLFIYYLYLVKQINRRLNKQHLLSIKYQSNEQWQLNLSNNSCLEGKLMSMSILTNYFALLQFKVGRWKKVNMVVLHNQDNHADFCSFAKWWYGGKKTNSK